MRYNGYSIQVSASSGCRCHEINSFGKKIVTLRCSGFVKSDFRGAALMDCVPASSCVHKPRALEQDWPRFYTYTVYSRLFEKALYVHGQPYSWIGDLTCAFHLNWLWRLRIRAIPHLMWPISITNPSLQWTLMACKGSRSTGAKPIALTDPSLQWTHIAFKDSGWQGFTSQQVLRASQGTSPSPSSHRLCPAACVMLTWCRWFINLSSSLCHAHMMPLIH